MGQPRFKSYATSYVTMASYLNSLHLLGLLNEWMFTVLLPQCQVQTKDFIHVSYDIVVIGVRPPALTITFN